MFECRKCGRHNEEHYRFCLGCGASLGDQRELEITKGCNPAVRPPKSAAAPVESSVCGKCNAELASSDVFCSKCGTRAEPGETQSADETVLVLIEPDGSEGHRHLLEAGENLVGRDDAPFATDPYVSPHHATFVLEGDTLTVTDAGSVNGVFVRICDRVSLQHGSQVRIGLELLEFEAMESMESMVTAPDDTAVQGSPHSGIWGRLSRVAAPGIASHAWLLDRPAVYIGRDYGEITFAGDAFVSGKHAQVSHDDAGVWIEDVGSSNGTFLRVEGTWELRDGDVLLLGQQIVRVAVGSNG